MLLDLEIGMERGVNEIGMGGGFRVGGIKRDLIGVDTMFISGVGLIMSEKQKEKRSFGHLCTFWFVPQDVACIDRRQRTVANYKFFQSWALHIHLFYLEIFLYNTMNI